MTKSSELWGQKLSWDIREEGSSPWQSFGVAQPDVKKEYLRIWDWGGGSANGHAT